MDESMATPELLDRAEALCARRGAQLTALRRQVLAMLALEGALLGGVGAVAGLALGAAMGQVLIHVVNPQSFHWTMDTRWPVGLFAALWLGLVVASALTAVLAGRSVLSADAVRAVREDW